MSADPASVAPSERTRESLQLEGLLRNVVSHDLHVSPLSGDEADQRPPVTPAPEPDMPGEASEAGADPMEAYTLLQRRLLRLTLVITASAAVVATFCFGWGTCFSLLVGSASGLLYLKLLSRSVERLGQGSGRVGRTQLLVPLLLILLALRLDTLALAPVLIGFLLYKPAMLLIAASDLTTDRLG